MKGVYFVVVHMVRVGQELSNVVLFALKWQQLVFIGQEICQNIVTF